MAFFEASDSEASATDVCRHLEAGCLPCLLVARGVLLDLGTKSSSGLPRQFLGSGDTEGSERLDFTQYVAQLERKAVVLHAEEKLAPGLLAELMLRPPLRRREEVRTSRRYQFLAVSEAFRSESRDEVFRDVARALELAELSAEVASCLDSGFYGPRLVADARALAWAEVGNGRRISNDLFGAEHAFQTALDFLAAGTGGPTEEAEIFCLLASLRTEQGQFGHAIRHLDRAASAYRSLGLDQKHGRTAFQLGTVTTIAGEPGTALQFFQSALDLLDPDDDPKLILWIHHNVASALNESGASEEARQYLNDLAPMYGRFPEDRLIHVRRCWLEGLIAAGTGDSEGALSALGQVRQLFIEEERAFDTALVTLDMTAIHLDAGQLAEAKALAKEMYPVFRSHDIHRQAVAALLLFERAVAAETATAAFAQDVARYLMRARNNPYLQYEPADARQ